MSEKIIVDIEDTIAMLEASPELAKRMTELIAPQMSKLLEDAERSHVMRAKMRVTGIRKYDNSETLCMSAVCKSDGYPSDGTDEDNSYARWTPFGELTLGITNPALVGKFTVGDKFYLDFTRAE